MSVENQMPANNIVRPTDQPYFPPQAPTVPNVANYFPAPPQNYTFQPYEQRPVREKFVKVPGDRPYQCQTCMKCFKR